MAIRNVLTDTDPTLRLRSKEVKAINDHIKETMADMLETMRHKDGVGIAAPQIGVRKRMFIAEPEPEKVYYLINPEILEKSGSEEGEEGCLSVPGKMGMVKRPTYVKVKALDLDGNENTYEFEDFYARVVCHEFDHLEGILYTDIADRVYRPGEESPEE